MDAVRQELARLQQRGASRYAVLDALTEHHLEIQGEALRDAPLVTAVLSAIGLARQWAQENGNRAREAGHPARWARRSAPVHAQMTNRQVAHYRQIAPAREVDSRCLSTETLAAYARTGRVGSKP